jgi:hypothetical protein
MINSHTIPLQKTVRLGEKDVDFQILDFPLQAQQPSATSDGGMTPKILTSSLVNSFKLPTLEREVSKVCLGMKLWFDLLLLGSMFLLFLLFIIQANPLWARQR